MTISFRGFALAVVMAFVVVWLSTYTIDRLAHSAGYFAMATNAPEAVQTTEQTRIIWDAQVAMTGTSRTLLFATLGLSILLVSLIAMALSIAVVILRGRR